ncbi:transglutaminase domain-containing protein [uncultured Algibacter sp.]|uniref:transglutaminase domain-containing protein n=1 Tax=uncultured Algibacter sp. TaxID=298659 RepID=UPI00260581D3|nr:transglutaminase domain-containing protein [uncultured Algibacter sp.]
MFKKLVWIFKRHPLLYKTRFKLLSKNSTIEEIKDISYNQVNVIDDLPSYFFEINAKIFKDFKPTSDLDLVKHLSLWLENNIKGGPGLSEPSEKALKIMLEGKGGVCSDMTQIFNNFCVINGVKVREWGVTRAPFDSEFGGHSFNEVFCKELDKWVLIDVSYGIMFYHNNEMPLSVVELYKLVRQDIKVNFKSFHEVRRFKISVIVNNFLDRRNVPFLICDYSNKVYDSFLNFFKTFAPVFVIHFLVYLFGKSYHYKFALDDYRKIFV